MIPAQVNFILTHKAAGNVQYLMCSILCSIKAIKNPRTIAFFTSVKGSAAVIYLFHCFSTVVFLFYGLGMTIIFVSPIFCLVVEIVVCASKLNPQNKAFVFN